MPDPIAPPDAAADVAALRLLADRKRDLAAAFDRCARRGPAATALIDERRRGELAAQADLLDRAAARIRALTEVADAARATLETESDLPEGIDAAVRLRLAVCVLDGRDVA